MSGSKEEPAKAAAKVVAVAAGASAKDIEKESTAARILGAGIHIARQSIYVDMALTQYRLRRHRRTPRLSPRRHNRQTSHVQPEQSNLRLTIQQRNLQIPRLRAHSQTVLHSISWLGICGSI